MGVWLSWESACFACRRPGVRIPSSPPRRRGIYIRGGFIFAGRRLARAEAAQVRGLDHSERYVGRALLLAGRNPLVLTVNSGAAALQRPLARFGYRLSLNRYMTLLLCGFTDAAAAV